MRNFFLCGGGGILRQRRMSLRLRTHGPVNGRIAHREILFPAEGQGFEPWVPRKRNNGFRDRPD